MLSLCLLIPLQTNALLKLISLFGTSCSLYRDLFFLVSSKVKLLWFGVSQSETCLQLGQVVSSGRKDLARVRIWSLLWKLLTMSLYGFSCHVGSQRKASVHGNQGLLKETMKKKSL